MKANEFSSNIQYKSSFITECELKNNLVDIGEDAELQSSVKVAVSNPYVLEDSHEWSGRVRLTLDGGYSVSESKDAQCKYHIVLIGDFAAPAETKREDFVSALWLNASTALYSIARGKLEAISSMVFNNGKIVLPMINMMELLKAQSEAENQK